MGKEDPKKQFLLNTANTVDSYYNKPKSTGNFKVTDISLGSNKGCQ